MRRLKRYTNTQAGPLTHPDHLAGVRGVIFDCDGVLLDSQKANATFYNCILEGMGLPGLTPEQEAYCHVHTASESLMYVTPEARWGEIPAAARSVDYRRVLPHLRVEPGLYALLKRIKRRGLPMAIHTNRTTTTEMVLDHFCFHPYLRTAMDARRALAKPHPEGSFRILARWGLAPDEVAFVGDSDVDRQTAENAGLVFWAYKNPSLRAHLHVPDFFALSQALARAWGACPCHLSLIHI